jgi:hypothetical protein
MLTINPGVVAAIHVAGVRGDPWTAVQRTAPQGSPRTPATCIAATTPELTVEILNSVFFLIFNFFLIFKYSVTLARYRHTP